MVQVVIKVIRATHSVNVAFGHLVNFAQLLKQGSLALLFVFVRVHFAETKVLNFLFAHEIMLHAALQIGNLKLLATFRHQLMLLKTSIIPDCVFFALVEVIQWEGSLVRGCSWLPAAAVD